jgi:orotidine-5'-phosphate decarboxylase
MPSFAGRFLTLAQQRSPLCVGIDPSVDLLRQWDLPFSPAGLERFVALLLEAVGDSVAIAKPQSAFFEQFGPKGLVVLQRLLRELRARGTLSLVDCKRGDIGNTVAAYADVYFGAAAPLGADAITVTAYLGIDALRPFFTKANAAGAGVFVVVRSSNPEGLALQTARLPDGRMVADSLADSISEYNRTVTESVGPVGAVIGATAGATIATTLARLPQSLFLAPGIGAQGASFTQLAEHFGAARARAIPAVSRGILSAGPSVAKLQDAILRHRDQAFAALNSQTR